MKTKSFFLLLSLLMVIVSCQIVVETEITTTAISDVTISNVGGSATISFSANKAWSASSSQPWCTVSPSSGEPVSGGVLTIQCEENPDYDERNCTVRVTCEDKSVEITIIQSSAKGLFASLNNSELTCESQTVEVELAHNVDVDVVIPGDCQNWISVVSTKGLTKTTFVLSVEENKSWKAREGVLTFKQKGGDLIGTVSIKQEGATTPPENEIWYTSNDGNVISIASDCVESFGSHMKSNYYEDGMGVIEFDGAINCIPKEVFYRNATLETILLPNSITSIQHFAFGYCSNLLSIIIPEGVLEIGDWAFSFCDRLSTVQIPGTLNSFGAAPFVCCPSLSAFAGEYATADGRALVKDNNLVAIAPCGTASYTIPDGIVRINRNVFYNCSELVSVEIPDGVTEIEMAAFAGCTQLESVVLPQTIEYLGLLAFSACNNLVAIHIPESTQMIENDTFMECVSLKEFTGKFASADHRLLVIQDEIIAFAPSGVTSYSIPNGITSIGVCSFYATRNLQSIVIPDTVERIGQDAFAGSGLCSLVLPGSIKIIEKGAFWGCDRLGTIDILPAIPPQGGEDMFKYSYCPIYVPYNSLNAYRTAQFWSPYADRIKVNPYNGHEYVDLGLSVRWAVKNIGAGIVSDYGSYYAWGELRPKNRYDASTYLLGTYRGGVLTVNYYNSDDHWTRLQLYDDIARQVLGGEWRMPTVDECKELINNCSWEKRMINNVDGILLTSRINGNTIFFPCAGLFYETTHYYAGGACFYWTSTKPSTTNYEAYWFGMEGATIFTNKGRRVEGLPVRAVIQ